MIALLPPTDRRRFLRWLGFTGVWAAAGAPGLVWAQAGGSGRPKPATTASGRDTTAAPAPPSLPPASAPPPGATTPQPITEEARALARSLRERYPNKIADTDLETVTRDIDGDLRASRRLRARKLTNDVEPDVTFRP